MTRHLLRKGVVAAMLLAGLATPALAQQKAQPAVPDKGMSVAASAQAVSDANDALQIAQFLTYEEVPADDAQRAKAAIIAAHAENLARDPHGFDGVRALAAKIRRAPRDTVLRSQVWGEVARAVSRDPGLGQRGLIGFVLHYNPILVNNGDGITVLRSDLQLLMASQVITRALMRGETPNPVPPLAEYQAMALNAERELPTLWPRLSPQDRRKVEEAESRYGALRDAVRNPAQRQALQATAQRLSGTDPLHATLAIQDQTLQLRRQQARRSGASVAGLSRANQEIFRMGLLANQFTTLSSRIH